MHGDARRCRRWPARPGSARRRAPCRSPGRGGSPATKAPVKANFESTATGSACAGRGADAAASDGTGHHVPGIVPIRGGALHRRGHPTTRVPGWRIRRGGRSPARARRTARTRIHAMRMSCRPPLRVPARIVMSRFTSGIACGRRRPSPRRARRTIRAGRERRVPVEESPAASTTPAPGAASRTAVAPSARRPGRPPARPGSPRRRAASVGHPVERALDALVGGRVLGRAACRRSRSSRTRGPKKAVASTAEDAPRSEPPPRPAAGPRGASRRAARPAAAASIASVTQSTSYRIVAPLKRQQRDGHDQQRGEQEQRCEHMSSGRRRRSRASSTGAAKASTSSGVVASAPATGSSPAAYSDDSVPG